MIAFKFSKEQNKEFALTLKKRVRQHFQENKIDPNANEHMVYKSAIVISAYLIPYFLMLTLGISNIPLLFFLWFIMGMSMAAIGTSVMHDAIHGSYSKNKLVNRLMSLSAVIIGADPKIWAIQHNVLHHSYTNIEHGDEDIQPRFVLRFTPNQPLRWFHQFQYVYAFFFYSISTLVWVTFKDFFKLFHYKKLGLIKGGKEFKQHLLLMIFRKSVYHFIFLVVPILVLPVSAWMVVLMFVTMHLTAGLFLSLVFQTAHVMPDMQFIELEDEFVDENWSAHQLYTTSNYAMDNGFLTWLVGSLNYQIEHHLFPNICHVHYKGISEIVRDTAHEYGLPYHSKETFGGAIMAHIRLLKQLGKQRELVPQLQ